ncbi:GH25 family lysozyme [Chloroflexus sp.]|uniref:GH25 family lysozyme n=1 Tax=Chloroflexus sp. TaxID=1904827 RepID=UPI002ACD8CE1|nr:GH25 family lysozyme [Chloroflexus sp.]
MKRIGWQTYPTDFAEGVFMNHPPPLLKILDPHLNLAVSNRMTAAAKSRRIPVVWRFVKFYDDRDPNRLMREGVDPSAQAEADFKELSPLLTGPHRPDFLECFNEPSHLAIPWMERYYRRMVELLRPHGIRVAGWNFATGNPPDGVTVPAIPDLVVGAHEYFDRGDPQVGYHLFRYRKWVPPGSEVIITETGGEPCHGGLTLDRMWWYDALLTEEKQYRILGGAFFLLDSPGWWAEYHMPREWIPAFRREEVIVSEGVILRAIDVSAWTGPISSSQAKALAEDGIRLIIVQIHGGGPGGTGVNRHLFQQLAVAREAGMMVAGYIWPPRAVMERHVQDILSCARDLRFVALDVEAREGVHREHVQAVEGLGHRPVIYSSPGEWAAVMRNSTEFRDVAYWEANYVRKFRNAMGNWNGRWPDESDRPWIPVTRGGWFFSPIWQFVGTTTLHGVKCDLNVVHRIWLEGGLS